MEDDFSELAVDPSLAEEDADELNDLTFGGDEPLSDEWEMKHQQAAGDIEKMKAAHGAPHELPAFFSGELHEQFTGEDEPLEPEGEETFDDFPTARHAQQDFFFLETESETNEVSTSEEKLMRCSNWIYT